MMLSSSSDAAQGEPLRVRQGDKFNSRLLSRKSSSAAGAATPSFRDYYGVASGAVPFVWESQPGTPKHPCSSAAAATSDDDLPPLIPPPSYWSSPLRVASPRKGSHGPNLLKAIVPRIARRKGRGGGVPPSPQASPSSSPPSPASYFSPVGCPHCQDRLKRRSSARSPFSSMAGDEGPVPCFTVHHGSHLRCGKMVKKALLSIIRHGSRIARTPQTQSWFLHGLGN